jgi:hypothetical protein
MNTNVILALSMSAAALVLSTCIDKKFEETVPKEFDAAFVTGEICLPSNIATGTSEQGGAPEFPIRIETCVYRCVKVDRSTVNWHYAWRCQGDACYMALLITGHVTRIDAEKRCDARDLPDPPKSECKNEVFEYMIDPPCCMGEGDEAGYVADTFVVTVPYLTLEEGEEVIGRINDGEPVTEAAAGVVGNQSYPARQFTVNFDPSHPVISSHDALGEDTCHHIPAP